MQMQDTIASMAKILLPAFGSRGDVQPLLALALELQARGHSVSVAAPPDFETWITTQGVHAIPHGPNAREMIEQYGPELSHPLRMFRHLGPLVRENIQQQYEELMPMVEGYDMLVSSSLQFAGFSAAEYYQIPYHYIVYCPNLMPADSHMPMIYPFPYTHPHLHRLCWWNEKKAWNLLLRPIINRERARWGLKPIQQIYESILTPRPILAAYSALAPYGASKGDYPAEQTAALHLPTEPEPLPADLESFIQAGEAPFYLGFGSMDDGKAAQVTQWVVDVAQHSEQRFVLSKGWAGLGQQALPENIYVTGPVRHELLFPRMCAVIHHGGAGTTAMAARSGVPQQILPHLLDQYYWGRQVYTRGLGPRPLPKARLNPQRFARMIHQLQRPDYAARAQALGRRLQQLNGVQLTADFVLRFLD